MSSKCDTPTCSTTYVHQGVVSETVSDARGGVCLCSFPLGYIWHPYTLQFRPKVKVFQKKTQL